MSSPDDRLAQLLAQITDDLHGGRQPDIDALIWHRHVDHTQEGGLKLGLWTTKPGTISEPGRKRPFYDLFLKADTPAWDEAAKFALPIVGLKSWDELKGP